MNNDNLLKLLFNLNKENLTEILKTLEPIDTLYKIKSIFGENSRELEVALSIYNLRTSDIPTSIYNGNKIWKNKEGQLHRIGGPAIEYPNGDKEWLVNGKLHRIDGPAIEYVDGSKEWWVNGKRHRIDGPAGEYSNGDKEWFVNGKECTEKEFKEKVLNYYSGTSNEIILPTEIDLFGNKYWRNERGQLHREDGPAAIYINGEKHWHLNGKHHRIDGPAYENVNGDKGWFFNGYELDKSFFDQVIGYVKRIELLEKQLNDASV